jgi:hypothetical protein
MEMDKGTGSIGRTIRLAVALVLRPPAGGGSFLAVRRPPDDESLPDVWGLPATTVKTGESITEAARRIGTEKLGAQLAVGGVVGVKWADRGDYDLVLIDIGATAMGAAPNVARATTSATRYVDQQWTDRLELLTEAASRGSLCSQILLDVSGVPYRTSEA